MRMNYYPPCPEPDVTIGFTPQSYPPCSRGFRKVHLFTCQCRGSTESSSGKLDAEGTMEALLQENIILKRAVGIQHERQKESEERNQELQHLKQMVTQYQEQLRTLEGKGPLGIFLVNRQGKRRRRRKRKTPSYSVLDSIPTSLVSVSAYVIISE